MSGDIADWVTSNGRWLAITAVLGVIVLYVLWVSRPNPVYRSSHMFRYPIDAVFDAYYPHPGSDLAGHKLEGLAFLFVGRGYMEVRLPGGAVIEWQLSRPERGAWMIGPITMFAHTFTPVDGGTRVDVEVPCRFPSLWSRLQAPFMGSMEADRLRDWLRARTVGASGRNPFPVLKISPVSGFFGAALLAALAWQFGWQTAVGFLVVFAANAGAGVAAARWLGHAASSTNLMGAGDLGAAADHREIAIKSLAGPAGGFLACTLLFAVCALVQARDQMWLLPSLVYMHAVVLAPIAAFPGGSLVRSILVSIGPRGRFVWLLFAGIGLGLAAYQFLWVWGGWWMVPVIAFAGLIVFYDGRKPDDLPRMGWRSITVAITVYLVLAAGHFGLARLAQAAVMSDRVVVVPPLDRVRALHLADGANVAWEPSRQTWWNTDANRPVGWGSDLLAQPRGPDGEISISLDRVWPFRLDLSSRRQCVGRISPRTERFWQPRRVVLDDSVIDRLDCRDVSP